MELEIILKSAAIVLLISLTILVFYLIFYFNSLNRLFKSTTEQIFQLFRSIQESLTDISKNIDSLKNKMEQTLGNLDSTSIQIRKSFENLNEKVGAIESIYKPFKELSDYVYQRVATPLQTTSRVISGISKGINVFVDFLSKKTMRNNEK